MENQVTMSLEEYTNIILEKAKTGNTVKDFTKKRRIEYEKRKN